MAVAAVIVENGSIVAGANSYASVAVLRQYAENNGITNLPADDAAVAVLLFQALQYIEARESRFQGYRTSECAEIQQILSWPRSCIILQSGYLFNGVIPPQLIAAQCQLACDVALGFAVLPTMETTGNLKKKVVGPITKEYFDPRYGTVAPTVIHAKAEAYLRPLYANNGAVRTNRA